MNWPHVHLVFSHVPVLGCIIGLLLLIVALVRSSRDVLIAALWIFLLSALTGIPAFVSGNKAEDTVEHLAGVSESVIDEHEETAEFAFWGLEGLGVLALAALTRIHRNKRIPRWLGTLTLVTAVTASILLGWTANLGGLIRHPEIHSVTTGAAPPARNGPD